MSATLYTADIHFGHAKVAQLRGFDEVPEHDIAICDRWRQMVLPSDTIWVLGDLCADERTLDYALHMIGRLPGTKHLIAGNHDACHPLHRDAHKWQRKYLEVFESVQAFAVRRWNGQRVLLSHFPYAGQDHTEVSRFDEFRLADSGMTLVHGHTHSDRKVSHSAQGTLQIHVGLDAWGLRPVPQNEIERIIAVARPAEEPVSDRALSAIFDLMAFDADLRGYGPQA